MAKVIYSGSLLWKLALDDQLAEGQKTTGRDLQTLQPLPTEMQDDHRSATTITSVCGGF